MTFFNETYPNGSITTELISSPDSNMVVIKASVVPDVERPERRFTGYSQARWDDKSSMVNASAAMENAETSAVGRALAMMGIGIIDSVASADEMRKAEAIVSIAKPADHPDNEFNQSKCQKCGAPIAISSKGNPYCTAKCWLKEDK